MNNFKRLKSGIIFSLGIAAIASLAANARAQLLTRQNEGWSTMRSTRSSDASYDTRLLPPSNRQSYRPTYPPQSTRPTQTRPTQTRPTQTRPTQTRLAPKKSVYSSLANYLPPAPTRVYRGQEPADLRPRLNAPPTGSSQGFSSQPLEFRAPSYPCRPYAPYTTRYTTPYTTRYTTSYDSAPPVAAPANAYRPIYPLAPMPQQYYIGRGSLGQPKVYVPGQPIRNFIRYITL